MSASNLTVIDHTHWFIADTHLGHAGILEQSARPYDDIEKHDQDIVTNWNAVVNPRDTVWHLGDLAWEKASFGYVSSTFKKLNGIKRLIVGNHDGDEVQTGLDWASVDEIRTVVAPGCKIVLCHYPMRDWNGQYGGDLHFHGHSHDQLPSSRQSWDCGVDRQAFRPMTFDTIKKLMDGLPHWDFAGSASGS